MYKEYHISQQISILYIHMTMKSICRIILNELKNLFIEKAKTELDYYFNRGL